MQRTIAQGPSSLLAGDVFLRRLVDITPRFSGKRQGSRHCLNRSRRMTSISGTACPWRCWGCGVERPFGDVNVESMACVLVSSGPARVGDAERDGVSIDAIGGRGRGGSIRGAPHRRRKGSRARQSSDSPNCRARQSTDSPNCRRSEGCQWPRRREKSRACPEKADSPEQAKGLQMNALPAFPPRPIASYRLSLERVAGTTSPFGVMPFRNLNRSLSVDRTRVVFSAMRDL
jgi:hypothetical protein